MINTVCLFVTLLRLISSISIVLGDGDQVCYNIFGMQGEVLTVIYQVSGQNEDTVTMDMFDNNDDKVHTIENKKEGTHSVTMPDGGGRFQVCFRTLVVSTISFDFQLSSTIQKNYAKPSEVKNVIQDFKSVSQNFQSIYRNQHFQSEREAVHQSNLLGTQYKLKVYTVLKLSTAILLTFIQLYYVKRFTDNFNRNNTV